MRGVSRFFWAFSLGVLPFFPVEARERLVMPFDCSLEGGDLRLSPATETSYPIVGLREERTITTCARPRPDGASCRTVMVHRFAVSCAGTSVDWMRIAAAIRTAAANRAWIENGRLNLVMPTRGALGTGSELPHAAVTTVQPTMTVATWCAKPATAARFGRRPSSTRRSLSAIRRTRSARATVCDRARA